MTRSRPSQLPRLACTLACALFLLSSLNHLQAARIDDREAFFESKVRPLLIQHCIECHGAEEQSGQIRLDRAPSGQAEKFLVPGKPDESKLIQAIHYRDADKAMPPSGKLNDEQIAILTAWITDGAFWPANDSSNDLTAKMLPPAQRIQQFQQEHWAFQPIKPTSPPEVDSQIWSKNSIDRFIYSQLQKNGVKPNEPADKRALILRAYFTLVGLPPSYEQIEAFQADQSPDAFAKIVDQLLENPHYGERWARHWLDIARYAETTGYLPGSVDTTYPYAYTYRDYVIKAFNSDKPYNQFVMEQIAADRLELKESEREALAALGFLTVGRTFMNRVHDIIDDRIDVVTRGFMGLSVTCARCHDHKYDPVPTADYYSLYGIFASSSVPDELPLLGNPADNPEYEQYLAARTAKEKEVEEWLDKKRIETEVELRARTADYLVHLAMTRPNSGHSDVKQIGDRGALRPQAVQRWKKFVTNHEPKHPIWKMWKSLVDLPADGFSQRCTDLLSEQSQADWLNQLNPQLLSALREKPAESLEQVARVIGHQMEAADAAWLELRKKDESKTQLEDAILEAVRAAYYEDEIPTQLTIAQMREHLNQAERDAYNQQLSKVKAVDSKHEGAPGRAMVVNDKGSPHDPVVFLRGQPGNRGDQVPRRFLQVLSFVDGQSYSDSGRLQLAKAIASPQNPLTARVIVNRIWQQHFGHGLVRTSSDFGSRGEPPSHPELLDFLAAELIADGWSIKRLQRRIMLSSAWQSSSADRAENLAIDPENRMLWRMPRRRLEFEPLRDRWLVAAGNLDQRIGGRSVKIHEDATRRALYAYMDREDVPGLLAAFDLPSPDASQAIRSRTTVPQQALYMINSKFVISQATAVAQKFADKQDPAQRITELYRCLLSRDPVPDELELAMRFVTEPSVALDPWAQFAQVLMSCNEFAFVD